MDYTKGMTYAVLAAVAAALVGILGKAGMKGINADLATALRSIAQAAAVVLFVTMTRLWSKLHTVHATAAATIVLSGLAGAASWIFGFRAIQLIGVAKTAPIDKLSVPLAVVLAVAFLGERPSKINWLGVGLITVGAYLAAVQTGPSNSR
jgi:transporter family protein